LHAAAAEQVEAQVGKKTLGVAAAVNEAGASLQIGALQGEIRSCGIRVRLLCPFRFREEKINLVAFSFLLCY
jgi:hypothetical protein